MNDTQLKRVEVAKEEQENLSPKKVRGTFFGVEIENEVSLIKTELLSQTHFHDELARVEYAEINRLFDEKTAEFSAEMEEESGEDEKFESSKSPADYFKKLRFLSELSWVLKRIKPYCNFLDDALLSPLNRALEKIRQSCGCDLNNPDTWKLAQPHTDKICKQATQIEIRKLKLSRLYDYLYDEMEDFVFSYKSSDGDAKERFFAQLNREPQLLAWTMPFIELAESQIPQWEMALMKSIASLSDENVAKVVVEKRVYI